MNLGGDCDSNTDASQLINALLSGSIDSSDFRLEINQFSTAKARSLFRDCIPKFTANLRSKFVNIFERFFFNNNKIQSNELWKYVDHRDFWIQMKKLHDSVYSRDLNFNHVVKYFEECLFKNNTKLDFRYLERRIVNILNREPNLLFKKISAILGISQKKTSLIIKELRSRGIFLGSTTDYTCVNSVEFFSFNISDSCKQNAFLIDEYFLFPSFKIFHGIAFTKERDDSKYYVEEKKTRCNTQILNSGISIQDWKKHEKISKAVNTVQKNYEEKSFPLISRNKIHILHLMKNCERNYRRPNIHGISEKYNVSVRTLFRTKSKLTDAGIIKPILVIDCDELMKLLIISKHELNELYNKIPFVESFKVQDSNHDFKWITFLSIFVTDFKFLYSLLMNNAEIFQVMNRKQLKLMKENKSTSHIIRT